MKVTATSRVGAIRVRPVSTTKVRNADSSATVTANGASHLRKAPLLDSANDGSNDGAEESALVIPAMGSLKSLPVRRRDTGGRLMHSYHNVAKLRQFRGVSDRENASSSAAFRLTARGA
jgi:hypothetical protein